MRAVVTEIRETSAVVLCEDGQIRLIPAQNFHKGQEITLSAGRRRIRRPLMWAACVAALCAMATTSVYAVCEPYSSVTVDGEESVEYTLNRFDWVIGTPSQAERKILLDAFERAIDAAACLIEHGCQRAMNDFN